MLVAPARACAQAATGPFGCEMAFRAMALGLSLLLFLDACVCEYSSSALSVHIDTLLAEYDREVAPTRPAAVTLALDVRHAALDDATQTMRVLADLKMNWADPRLVWNSSQWEGDSIIVSAERVWSPDVQLRSAGRARGAGGGLRARVGPAGAVSCVQRLELAVPVALEMAAWPRDEQRAPFIFASRAHAVDEIDFRVVDNTGTVVIENGGWEVKGVTSTRVTFTWMDGAKAAGARFTVRVERRGAALAAAQGAVLAAAMLLLAAATSRPYAQRLPLAAASTLVSALWLMSVMVCLPAAGSTPRVVRVMSGACAGGALAALGAALAAAVARRAAPPPPALRALLSKLSALHSITPDTECGGQGSGAWAAAAALLDAALGALLALAMLVMLLVYCLA